MPSDTSTTAQGSPNRDGRRATTYVVRQCIMVLLWHLVVIELSFWGIGALLNVLPTLIPETKGFLGGHSMLITSLLNLAEIFCLGYLILAWDCNYYLITPDKIISRRGIIAKDQETCAIKNIESVDFHQSIIGRIFGFGTIKLFAPTLDHVLHMDNIHHPEKKMLLIESLLPNTNASTSENKRDLLIVPRLNQQNHLASV